MHLNPVRAGLLRPGQPLEAYRWSSYPVVKLAARLRADSPVTVSWIAERLAMGTRGHLAHLLYRNAETSSEPLHANQPSLSI